MTLKKGFILSQKKALKQKSAVYAGKKSAIVDAVLNTKEGKINLNQRREVTELHNMVQSLAEGGIYKNELRELADKLAHGHEAKYISHKEGRAIAKVLKEKFYPELKKYKSSPYSSLKSTNYSATGQTPESKNSTAPTANTPMTPNRMANIINRARANSLENTGEEQPKSNFLRALKATEESKRN